MKNTSKNSTMRLLRSADFDLSDAWEVSAYEVGLDNEKNRRFLNNLDDLRESSNVQGAGRATPGRARVVTAAAGTVEQAISDTMAAQYRRAQVRDNDATKHGNLLRNAEILNNISALWLMASHTDSRKYSDANTPLPTPPPASSRIKRVLMVLFATVCCSLRKLSCDDKVLAAEHAASFNPSRIDSWAAEGERAINAHHEAQAPEGDNETMLDAWQIYQQNPLDRAAAELAGACHGYATIDASNGGESELELLKLRELSQKMLRRAVKVTPKMLEDDGCWNRERRFYSKKRGKISYLTAQVPKQMSVTDSYRDEVGPWVRDYDGKDGKVKRAGYEGTITTVNCEKCGNSVGSDGRCVDPDCGYKLGMDAIADSHTAELNHAISQEKRHMADERIERSGRFMQEWQDATNCDSTDAVYKYQMVWARYRARQMDICSAIEANAAATSLWSQTWLTKEQFRCIEWLYAVAAGMTDFYTYEWTNQKTGEVTTEERYTIAQTRLSTAELTSDLCKGAFAEYHNS